MSAAEVLAQFGTWRLVKFVVGLLLFVMLHLMRLPVLVLVKVLEGAMSRVDKAVTGAVSRPQGSTSVAGEGFR